jgi:hypothetical protein
MGALHIPLLCLLINLSGSGAWTSSSSLRRGTTNEQFLTTRTSIRPPSTSSNVRGTLDSHTLAGTAQGSSLSLFSVPTSTSTSTPDAHANANTNTNAEDDIVSLVKLQSLSSDQHERIDRNFQSLSQQYTEAGKPSLTLSDPLLLGNYDVAYVSSGDRQRGNPAGGRFRDQWLLKQTGLYQPLTAVK